MRKSFHTLCGLVRNKIGGDPMNGDVYIFVNGNVSSSVSGAGPSDSLDMQI